MSGPWPSELRIRKAARELEITFDDGERLVLPARLLRAMTPSAQDRGHGGPAFAPFTEIRGDVGLTDAKLVGAYAVRLIFDDGHDSGLYTWDRLHRIGAERAALEAELTAAGV